MKPGFLPGLSRRLARAIPFRPHRWRLAQPVVSFSFDDFPASAARHGASLLEAHGARGTFYFADALAGGTENAQPIVTPAEVAALAARGHEIGGHTHGHADVQQVSPAFLHAEITANNAAIAALAGRVPSSFAYPFGIVSLAAKYRLARHYAGLRGIQPGINRGWIDLAHLRAEELYDRSLTPLRLDTLLDDLARRGGWLIFYTHDVRNDPSSIGCSPLFMAMVLEQVRRRGLPIQTIAAVLDAIGTERA
ncbi:MAG: hypothetical protein ABS76_04775 [Pelagibacterium sp. SCN 64-44]|nr:MAG: hypothetical protein ABS76_04775 [Pelagibacterium sp. SCN 64-44]